MAWHLLLLTITTVLREVASMPLISARATTAGSGPYSAIVAFGDSFTDNGNGSWVVSNH
ncbi:hypothetical protein C8Q80DRAFT_1139133 [Daedaleopsis nitida]|nr:hypothetical protein C8Q80DRAFT_1139133 [Daedaleopsis nitida]